MAAVSYAQQVELRVKCNKLQDKDVTSKSDPMVVLLQKTSRNSDSYTEVGRTERIKNNLNPRFVKAINITYHFEELQELKFVVYDVDGSETGPLSQNDFLGEIQCSLAEIVCSSVEGYTRDLVEPKSKNKKCGTITIFPETINNTQNTNANYCFKIYGTKLDKKDTFGKSDPFLIFNQIRGTNDLVPVHKTEIIKNTLNPNWAEFVISSQTLFGNDLNRPLLIQCYDWDRFGKNDLIGTFTVTGAQMLTSPLPQTYQLTIEKKKKVKNSGTITFAKIEKIVHYSFVDYILGGMEICLVCSIDFTGSNGNPTHKSSLHYLGEATNSYTDAITAVGEILCFYDTDKLVPIYGFGAKLPNGQVSHLFPLNGNADNPEVLHVQGMLAAYRNAVTSVTLYGPTNFAPTIRAAADLAKGFQLEARQKYLVLLIITDGEISDMNETIDAIIAASCLPLSIIIVGVGNADFASMDKLDSDNALLSRNYKTASRDIVQFVAYNDFKGGHYSLLAQHVLAEVPGQVEGYMKTMKMKPMILPEQLMQQQQMLMNAVVPVVQPVVVAEVQPVIVQPVITEAQPMVVQPVIAEVQPVIVQPVITEAQPMVVQPVVTEGPVVDIQVVQPPQQPTDVVVQQ